MGKTAILSVRILGDGKGAAQAFTDTEGKAGGFGDKLIGAGKLALGLGAAVVTGAAIAGGALYGIGETMAGVTNTIRVGTGAAGDNLDAMVANAKGVATTIPTTFEKAATAVADVNTRMGLTGTTLETVASQFLEAGRILGQDVDINTASAAFAAFGVKGDDIVGAMDNMLRVSQATGIGMNDLAGNVATNGVALSGLGFGFNDAIALTGSLDKAGIDASATLGVMKKGLVTLAKSGEEPVSAFKRVTGEIGAFIDSGDKAGALNLASQIFGTRGAAQFVGAVEQGVLGVGDLMSAAGVTEDTILGLGKETMRAGDKWAILKNKGLAALEPLATKVADGVGAGIDVLTTTLEKVDWSVFTGAAAGVHGALEGIGPVIQTVGGWITRNLIPPLMSVVGAVRDNWPMIVATVAGVFDSIQAKIKPLIPKITAIFTTVGEIIGSAFALAQVIISTALGAIMTAWELFGQPFLTVVAAIWDAVIGVVGPALDIIKSIIATVMAVLQGDWAGAWEGIQGIVSGAWDLVVGIITGALGIIGGIFSGGMEALGNIAGEAWAWLAETFNTGVGAVVSWVKGLPRKILDAVGNLNSLLGRAGSDVILGFHNAIVTGWNGLWTFVVSIPGRIRDTIGDLGGLLAQAGWAVIDGFIGPMIDAWNRGKNFISNIGTWIFENKGPISKDKTLLKPAGEAIMGGFIGSLKAAMPDLERWVNTATATVMGLEADPTINLAAKQPTTSRAGAGAGTGRGTINITVNGALDPTAVARQIRELLTTEARTRGAVTLTGSVLP